MKRSILVRFTMIFIGLMAAILLGIWGINNWMLEGFYINQKVEALQLAYTEMDTLVMEKQEAGESIGEGFSNNIDDQEETDVIELLRHLNDQYNITILIVDSFTNQPIAASTRDIKFMLDRAFQYMLGYNNPRTEVILEDSNYTIQKSFEKVGA